MCECDYKRCPKCEQKKLRTIGQSWNFGSRETIVIHMECESCGAKSNWELISVE